MPFLSCINEMIVATEGRAKLHYEEHDEVFFNPRGRLARSMGVLAARAFSKMTLNDRLVIADAFTGIGARVVRYLLEDDDRISVVHANDSSMPALEFAIRNVRLNGVAEKVKFHCLEARRFFWRSVQANLFYDIIDIDVFGTPMQFIPFAVNALKHKGAIYVTSTDTAPLCGINRRAAFRNYGAVAENFEFCHETGARIVIAAVVKAVAQQAYIARPLFTLFDGYAFRIFVAVQKGRRGFPVDKFGFVVRCPSSGRVMVFKQKHAGRFSLDCKSDLQIAGPLWIGELHDAEFLNQMLDELNEDWFSERDRSKLKKTIKLMEAEVGMPPFFHDISALSDRLNINTPRKADLINELRRRGFKAGMTHFSGLGIKTDADFDTLADIAVSVVKGGR